MNEICRQKMLTLQKLEFLILLSKLDFDVLNAHGAMFAGFQPLPAISANFKDLRNIGTKKIMFISS